MSGGGRYPGWAPGIELRNDWLARVHEDIIDPDREIVDPHHHLWVHGHGGAVYEMEALWADTGSGHNVVQTMFMECRSYYNMDDPEELRSVGEIETVVRMAATAKPGQSKIAGIISNADLRLDNLDDVLDAHIEAGQGLTKGIRFAGARDPDPDSLMIPGRGYEGQYSDPAFRRGVARLGERGLTYDTWHYHHQNRDYIALARAVPETTMILDHFGTPLGVGRFAGKREEIYEAWQKDMAELAKSPNVMAKLGGLCMPDNGWNWQDREDPPTSDELVAAQGKWYRHMIDCFGPERCMFESNFPVDRVSVSYPVLWNAFKKIAEPYSEAEKDMMFAGTARQVYGLSPA
ncbi:amidohydrolase family protein [Arenibacterium sp. CAU 1754]